MYFHTDQYTLHGQCHEAEVQLSHLDQGCTPWEVTHCSCKTSKNLMQSVSQMNVNYGSALFFLNTIINFDCNSLQNHAILLLVTLQAISMPGDPRL